jgi:hypothetical protein
MKKLFVLLVLFTLVLAFNSEAKPISVNLEVKFGDREKNCEGSGICSWKLTITLGMFQGSNNGDTQQMQAKGEIQNNMFVVNLSKEIEEKGRNQQGKFVFSVPKEMIVDQGIAKELGVEKLVISPGNYECKGNAVSFRIVSPRDISTGQSSGKKAGIAIDEQGVHNGTTPKPTYDIKENKK